MGTKAGREDEQLRNFFCSLGLRDDQWHIVERRERPDFIVTLHNTSPIGVELTELMTPDYGAGRAAEGQIVATVEAALREYLDKHAGRNGPFGAQIEGHAATVARPICRASLQSLRERFTAYLLAQLPLLPDPPHITGAPFTHDWGAINYICITPDDRQINSSGSGSGPTPHYREEEPSTASVIAQLTEIVTRKASTARGYRTDYPLWLVIRNPHWHMSCMRPALTDRMRLANAGRFDAIWIYNDPHAANDRRPPEPRALRLYPS